MHVYGKAEAVLCRSNDRSGANPLLSANPPSVSLSASQQIFQPQRFSGKFLGCLSQVCLYMCDFFLRRELRFRPWLCPWITVTQASCCHAAPFLTLQSSGEGLTGKSLATPPPSAEMFVQKFYLEIEQLFKHCFDVSISGPFELMSVKNNL